MIHIDRIYISRYSGKPLDPLIEVCSSTETVRQFRERLGLKYTLNPNRLRIIKDGNLCVDSKYDGKEYMATDYGLDCDTYIIIKYMCRTPNDIICARSTLQQLTGQEYLTEVECVVCLDALVETIFISCAHELVCVECAKSTKICPLCNESITYTYTISGSRVVYAWYIR